MEEKNSNLLLTPSAKKNSRFEGQYPFPILTSECKESESDPVWKIAEGFLQENSMLMHDEESMKMLYSMSMVPSVIPSVSNANLPLTPGGSGSIFHSTPGNLMTHMTPITPSADPGILPQITNVVSTANLNCKLDLKKIAQHARNAEYNSKRLAAVIMRIREPRTTALIFSTGKMVCLGARSEEQSKLAARKYARIVQKLGFEVNFLDFKIRNVVAMVDVNFPIILDRLVLPHSQFSSYEPELFPGLIYRMVKPRIVLLIFRTGKICLTGGKNRSEIYEAFKNIYPVLKGFRKQ